MSLRFAVIGSPIAHSRSPEMHKAAYHALNVETTYKHVLVEADELADFIA